MDKHRAEKVLELTGTYDAAALKVAFRRLATDNHPDAVEARGGNPETATARMQEINQAHDLLSSLFVDGVETLQCESAFSPPENPFEGSRYGSEEYRKQRPGRRQSTADYYKNDPRFQPFRWNGRKRSGETSEAERGTSWTPGAASVPKDPGRPNPRWYPPIYRFFALFPYRLALLLAICLLVNLTDPIGMGRTLGPFTFEEALLFLALLNLVVPIFTWPLRALLLWLVNRARALYWKLVPSKKE